jgi:magnesium and cobalt transporter
MRQKLAQWFSRKPDTEKHMLDTLHAWLEQKVIDQDALTMIEGVLNVSKMQVRDTMVPRAQMVCLQHDMSLETIAQIITETKHSRFPVIGDNKDHVVGVLLAKDLLSYMHKPVDNFSIDMVMRPAIFVPESKKLDNLLHEFQVKHTHMAIVVDEYGNVAGLVTIEDVLEKIVGDIEDEGFIDDETDTIHHAQPGCYTLVATATIKEVNEALGLSLNDEYFDTVGGYIAAEVGRIPQAGFQLTLQHYTFTIKKSTPKQILLIEATQRP